MSKTDDIADCLFRLAEAEGKIRTNERGEKVIYATHGWMIDALRRCAEKNSSSATQQ